MPILLNVLAKMKTEFYLEKEICMSNGRMESPGPNDLFKMLSQVTDMYKAAPHREVIGEMLVLSSK